MLKAYIADPRTLMCVEVNSLYIPDQRTTEQMNQFVKDFKKESAQKAANVLNQIYLKKSPKTWKQFLRFNLVITRDMIVNTKHHLMIEDEIPISTVMLCCG